MAHGAGGGAPPFGCWNACERRVDGSLAYPCAAFRHPGAPRGSHGRDAGRFLEAFQGGSDSSTSG
jgi:hypothetical protein